MSWSGMRYIKYTVSVVNVVGNNINFGITMTMSVCSWLNPFLLAQQMFNTQPFKIRINY